MNSVAHSICCSCDTFLMCSHVELVSFKPQNAPVQDICVKDFTAKAERFQKLSVLMKITIIVHLASSGLIAAYCVSQNVPFRYDVWLLIGILVIKRTAIRIIEIVRFHMITVIGKTAPPPDIPGLIVLR